ncbi:hypothetical protein [Streptomyces sp. WMMB303]|uniref:hypothetical protein n=1 Tax=Streptomyces sp. WMMB303 TaxID=3034154 RepID=UPI0023ED96CC|nr:hypothetical protein [Streptomyces sp. WMMB303]MDF4250090.1 hypothetical protein [Streptomyces sp. WMMB303]
MNDDTREALHAFFDTHAYEVRSSRAAIWHERVVSAVCRHFMRERPDLAQPDSNDVADVLDALGYRVTVDNGKFAWRRLRLT